MATHETETSEVRMFFGVGAIEFGDRSGEESRNTQFDRWLEQVKAEAWDEALDAIEQNELNTDQAREGNPHRQPIENGATS